MEKKYLFFDIDGTLTDRATGGIVPSAKDALQRLEENGHFVAIATGRGTLQGRKLYIGYGWCLVMDDTKDVYMKGILFRKIS